YGLFVVFVAVVAPRFVEAFASLRVPGQGAVEALAWLGGWTLVWGPIVPALVVVLVLAWKASGRSGAFARGFGSVPLRGLPWLGAMLAQARTANFAELLALLLEGGVGLPEAVELAAEATGDAVLRRDASVLAAAIRRG